MGKVTYAVVIEQATDGGWGGYALDVPGIGVGGYATPEAARESLRVAIELQLEAMRELGQPIPDATSRVAVVEVSA